MRDDVTFRKCNELKLPRQSEQEATPQNFGFRPLSGDVVQAPPLKHARIRNWPEQAIC